MHTNFSEKMPNNENLLQLNVVFVLGFKRTTCNFIHITTCTYLNI